MFDIDACLAFLTNKVSKKLADEFNDRLLPLGMTRVQWMAMYYLLKHGPLNQSELAEKMDVKNSTIARLADRMQKEGLIRREKDAADRRITYLNLTDKGATAIRVMLPAGQAMSDDIAAGITAEEFAVFKAVLDKMLQNIAK